MLFMVQVCLNYSVLSIQLSLVIACWERADPLCEMFSCVSVLFPDYALVEVWYLIVSISDICLLLHIQCVLSLCNSSLVIASMCCFYIDVQCR